MGFLDFIEKLQKKPERVRKRIAFFAISIIMFVIVVSWLATSGFRLSKEEDKVEAMIGPFSVLVDNFKEFGGAVKETFSQLQDLGEDENLINEEE